MTYRMIPSITLSNLAKELEERYDIKVSTRDLREILWFEMPGNNCYAPYYYGDGPSVDCNYIEAAVIDLLELQFPDWEEVLIDVSW